MGGWWGVQDSCFKILRERYRDALGQVVGHSGFHNKMKLQQMCLFNTTELCSHSQPSQDWPSFHLDPRLLARIATVLQKSSQQKQTTQV